MKHFKSLIINRFLYAGLNKKIYHAIENRVIERNVRNLRDTSIAVAIYAGFYLFLMLIHLQDRQLLVPYVFLEVVSLSYVLIGSLKVKGHEHQKRFIYSLVIILYFVFAAMNGTFYMPNHLAVTFNVMFFIVILLLTDIPLYIVPLLCLAIIIFIIMAFLGESGWILTSDLFNVAIFGMLAIYCNFKVSGRMVKQFAYELKIEDEKDHDGLTKVYTKMSGEAMITHLLENHVTGVLIIFDIDHFKRVNDDFGHLYGDYVLTNVASMLSSAFRRDDVICRFGGDEFMVFLKGATYDVAKKRVGAFYQSLKKELNKPMTITCSAGMAYAHGQSYKRLVSEADQTLYRVKSQGRDSYLCYGENNEVRR